ncbi:MAG TPA: cytochrome c biogenesis heme-transporting ATPase CcmA [Albitalea sp.]|uniref:cytochrome c biogenesis heme-transporting ATPase CcmA n=1 Tax=Piscinibacter sp. TaxID=1903157 RepID=UPI002ED496D1
MQRQCASSTADHLRLDDVIPSALPSSPLPAPRLVARELACRRGTRLLFKGLDLDVPAGRIVWLRGQNGRGKTSLLRLAAGLSSPEHGHVLIDGVPARTITPERALVFIAHANALKEDLSVSEALAFLLRLHGRASDGPTVRAALERLGLAGRRDAMVRTLSQGQRRRVALARLAVETAPSLWLLDEPFDALDTDGVERVNGLLVEHAGRGGSVLLTSHLALDAARLAPIEVDLDRYC